MLSTKKDKFIFIIGVVLVAAAIIYLIYAGIDIYYKCIYDEQQNYTADINNYSNASYKKCGYGDLMYNFFPKYDDIKDNARVLMFDVTDNSLEYSIDDSFQYARLYVEYDEDYYQQLKKDIKSQNIIKKRKVTDFIGYRVDLKEETIWAEVCFCDQFNVVFYFFIHNYDKRNVDPQAYSYEISEVGGDMEDPKKEDLMVISSDTIDEGFFAKE